MGDEWRGQAACRGLTPRQSEEYFFLGKGGSPKKARELCDKCPVRSYCRKEAVMYDEQGIWGGMTDKQRAGLSEDFKDHWLEQARQAGQLKEYGSIVPAETCLDSTQSLCCGATADDSCHCTLQQSHSSLQMDADIAYIDEYQTDDESLETISENLLHDEVHLAS